MGPGKPVGPVGSRGTGTCGTCGPCGTCGNCGPCGTCGTSHPSRHNGRAIETNMGSHGTDLDRNGALSASNRRRPAMERRASATPGARRRRPRSSRAPRQKSGWPQGTHWPSHGRPSRPDPSGDPWRAARAIRRKCGALET
eukprot:4833482-Pyramimonas_sp.AAC.1